MNIRFKKSFSIVGLIASINLVVFVAPVVAQNISVDMPLAKAAMKNGEWEKAHVLLSGVVKKFESRGSPLFGSKFGTIYYDKGYTELKLGRKAKKEGAKGAKKAAEYFTLARDSFAECRKIPDVKKGNFHFNKCLLYQGQSEQELGKYKEALRLYLQFIKVRDPKKDRYDVEVFQENIEICYAKDVENREVNLYNLVKTSSELVDIENVEKYSKRYFKDFPKGKHLDRVKRMTLVSLFYAGAYEKALTLSTDIMAGKKFGPLVENTKLHDLCLHVKGGSLHYLGKYAEAQPLLQKHVEAYPESDYVLASHYLEAANYSRNQDWHKAAEKLDKFLKDYSEQENNIYYPYALYDRAETYFSMMEEFSMEEYNQIYKLLDRIENEFKGSNIDAQSFILRGDVLRVERQKVKSRSYYLKALKVAEKQGRKKDAEHALYKLMSLLVGSAKDEEIKEAIGYYDKFWKKYPDSIYKPNVAVTGVHLMMSTKRGEEALANLRSVIVELSKEEKALGLEAFIHSYVKFYLKLGKTPEELEKHLFNGPEEPQLRLQALFRIAMIELYEDLEKKANDGIKANQYRVKIRAVYQDLARFKLTDLSDFLLFRIGNHLVDSKRPADGLKYFEQILKNGRTQLRTRALFKKAIILARLGNAEGLKLLNEIAENKENPFDKRIQAEASYEVIKFYAAQGSWKKVIEQALIYKERGYRERKAETLFFLAQGYDLTEDFAKAMAAYNDVYISYRRSNWELAVPALSRASELQWKLAKGINQKQIAYNTVVRFLKMTEKAFSKHKPKMSPKLVKDYEKLMALAKTWEEDLGIQPK